MYLKCRHIKKGNQFTFSPAVCCYRLEKVEKVCMIEFLIAQYIFCVKETRPRARVELSRWLSTQQGSLQAWPQVVLQHFCSPGH